DRREVVSGKAPVTCNVSSAQAQRLIAANHPGSHVLRNLPCYHLRPPTRRLMVKKNAPHSKDSFVAVDTAQMVRSQLRHAIRAGGNQRGFLIARASVVPQHLR